MDEKSMNMLNYTIKAIDNINMALLNLTIQAVQIQEDSASRGMLAAADHIRKTTEKLEKELIIFKKDVEECS